MRGVCASLLDSVLSMANLFENAGRFARQSRFVDRENIVSTASKRRDQKASSVGREPRTAAGLPKVTEAVVPQARASPSLDLRQKFPRCRAAGVDIGSHHSRHRGPNDRDVSRLQKAKAAPSAPSEASWASLGAYGACAELRRLLHRTSQYKTENLPYLC